MEKYSHPLLTDIPEAGAFAQAILPKGQLDKQAQVPPELKVPLDIIDDRSLEGFQGAVVLSGPEVFVFNALAKRRAPVDHILAKELLRLPSGIEPRRFAACMQLLEGKLLEATGYDIVTKVSRTQLFCLSPAVQISDKRDRRGRNTTVNPIISTRDTGSPSKRRRETPGTLRDDTIQAIVTRYKDHPFVARRLAEYQTSEKGRSQPLTAQDDEALFRRSLRAYRLLEAHEEVELTTLIATGLDTYRSTDLHHPYSFTGAISVRASRRTANNVRL